LLRNHHAFESKVAAGQEVQVAQVNRVAREFGGGGHVRASGALIPGTLEEVRAQVVARVVAEVDAARDRKARQDARQQEARAAREAAQDRLDPTVRNR
jgi:oligoribonuclease NrnB/cAMP/cGMP phosphodiesterase (DHH superfamily)